MLEIIILSIVIGMPVIIVVLFLKLFLKKDKKEKNVLIIKRCILIFYGISLFIVLFGIRMGTGYTSQQSLMEYIKYNSNIIPFKTIMYYINCLATDRLSKSLIIDNLMGNLIMFVPMGCLLPLIFKKQKKFGWFLLTQSIILISIEVGQLGFRLGSFDIDDLILNLVGAIVGFLLYLFFQKKQKK